MNGLRRHAPLLSFIFALTMVIGGLMGGLAFARSLPEAHAQALAHASLCAPGEDGSPGASAHHGTDCGLCPATATGAHLAAPHGGGDSPVIERASATTELLPAAEAGLDSVGPPAPRARAPPVV